MMSVARFSCLRGASCLRSDALEKEIWYDWPDLGDLTRLMIGIIFI
jgi:hypothetical protein